MLDSFEITLAKGVSMEVRPIAVGQGKEYDLYVSNYYHCTVYPDHGDAFIEWKSRDRIDQTLVTMIGRAITEYEVQRYSPDESSQNINISTPFTFNK